MGKLHSKHVCKREGPEGECMLGNAHMNQAISSDGSISQLETASITKKAFPDELFNLHSLPLRVLLPPEKGEKKVNMESDTTDNNVHTDKSINVEEFECGVSVEGSSSDKQEWNFTLYDFDGRGKITKEDLAQLLQSLYDAVGSSINLPQTGTRTLKLKLSVSPDNAKVTNVDASMAGFGKEDTTVLATATRPRKCQSKNHKDRENCRSRERHERTPAVGKDANDNVQTNQVFKLKLRKSNLVGVCGAGNLYEPRLEIKNNLSIGPAHSRSPGKRLSSHEHKHLAELIQKNMERNQQRQQHKIKRHHSEQAPKTSSRNDRATTHNGENPDRRNYYLDLAGIENFESSKVHNTTAPPGLLDTSAHGHGSHHQHEKTFEQSKLRSSKTHHTSDSKRHSRSHTQDASPGVTGAQTAKLEAAAEEFAVQYENAVEEEYVVPPQDDSGAAGPPAYGTAGASGTSPNPQPKSASTPKTHKFRPVSLPAHIPETVSPHHHRRHRHREKNHTRAMQQVAEWIDREVPSGSQHVVVQKHEHHHVHEHHHHHHYHHYHET